MALPAEVPLALKGPKLSALMNSSPTVAMNSSGTNFRTVVAIWSTAVLRTPLRLTIAGIHRPAMAMAMDQPVAWSLFQKTST